MDRRRKFEGSELDKQRLFCGRVVISIYLFVRSSRFEMVESIKFSSTLVEKPREKWHSYASFHASDSRRRCTFEFIKL